jgi:hypothetical protein
MKAWRRTNAALVARLAIGVGLLFFVAGVALAMRSVVRLVPYEPNFTIDFDYYVLAGLSLLRGENPYTATIAMHAENAAGGYVYPPLLAWLLVPLSLALPVRLPYLVWVIAEIAGFAACLALVLRAGANPVAWHWVILTVGAAFLPFITWDNLYHGRVDFVLMMLVTFGLTLVARGRPVAGGVLLALAPGVKPFLAVILIYLAWRCRWKVFFVAGFTAAALLVLSFVPTLSQGTAVIESWIEASRTQGMPPLIGHPFNHAIYGTLARLFTPTPFAVAWADNHALFLALALLFGLVAPIVWLLAVPPGPLRRQTDVVLSYVEAGLLLTLVFAYGPIAESNHLIALWPVVFVSLRLALSSSDDAQRRRWRPAARARGVFLLLTAGPMRQTTRADPITRTPEGRTVQLTRRVAVLLLLAGLATAWSVAHEHRAANPHLSLRSAFVRAREWLATRGGRAPAPAGPTRPRLVVVASERARSDS